MPRTVDPAQRRSEVAAAARSVIARDGFDATTVRRVAAEAGSSTTVVTHYFADKEALLLAAVQDAYTALVARMAACVDGGPGGLPTLRALLLEALPLDDVRAAEARVWLAFWSAAITRPTLREVQRESYREWREFIAQVLADAVRRDEVDPHLDLAAAAERLTCLMDGMLVQAALEPGRLSPERQIEMVDLALARL
ncbi:TetR/AcrR family transcriptional regulator [Smaragdicoccus niigatensis]|uniref:TetR/AcrR family transcriptional regulator n=1 Tax=Smaragdicoccus niigatensis TaxID=359359 RepID=UPI000360ED14|nr:TetR/AcrR family transcriptional regulator [Smaragdicoccus niigatensis]